MKKDFRHDLEPRDLILALKGAEVLLALINETQTDSMIERVTWTLSILCGATHARTAAIKDLNIVVIILDSLAKLIFWKEEENILSNCITALSHLLPLVEMDKNNKKVWERLIQLLTHHSMTIKRAGILAISNIISLNDMQCQVSIINLHFNNINLSLLLNAISLLI